jgi:hypothetical protein
MRAGGPTCAASGPSVEERHLLSCLVITICFVIASYPVIPSEAAESPSERSERIQGTSAKRFERHDFAATTIAIGERFLILAPDGKQHLVLRRQSPRRGRSWASAHLVKAPFPMKLSA